MNQNEKNILSIFAYGLFLLENLFLINFFISFKKKLETKIRSQI